MPAYIDPFTSESLAVIDLAINQKVQLHISKIAGLVAQDGSTMSTDVDLTFYTQADPLYASVEYIILNGGEVIQSIPEAAIYLMSFSNSLLIHDIVLYDIDARFPDKTTEEYLFFARARTEFVKCKTIADLMRAILASRGSSAGRKTLADFTVDLGSQANLLGQAKNYLSDAIDCYRYWQTVLYSGGSADHQFVSPQATVKSGSNPNEPGGIGRGWLVGGPTLNSREEADYNGYGSKTRPRRGYSGAYGYIRNPYSNF